MKIINAILVFAVLYFADYFFPVDVYCKDIQTVVIVTGIIIAVRIGFGLALLLSAMLIPVGVGCLTIIPTLMGAVVSTPIALYLSDKYMETFFINGTVPFLLLWATLSLFSFDTKTSR